MNKIQKIICFAVFFLLSIGIQLTAKNTALDLKALDIFRAEHAPHPDIVILAIDNQALQKIGRWPWSRSTQAKIIKKVSAYHPQILGIDVTFSESETDVSDSLFSESTSTADFPVVLSSELIYTRNKQIPEKILLPIPELRNQSNVSTGFTNAPLDSDGLTRSLPFPIKMGKSTYQPFATKVAQQLNADTTRPSTDYFVSFANAYPTYSLADLLAGNVPKEKLENKIILMGATAADLHDTVLVPKKNQLIPGIEWNANVLDNLLLHREISLLPLLISLSIGLLLILIFVTLTGRVAPATISFILLGCAITIPLISLILWQFGFALMYATNFILSILLFIFHGLFRWYMSEAEKRKLRRTVQPYFSPAVLTQIMENPSLLGLGGEKKDVSILFSDIRSFTTISENLSPEELITLLHEYFTEMTQAILDTDGVVDKFIGDAIMAFWGAPIPQEDHAGRAVSAAIKMYQRLQMLQKKWEKQGYPFIDIGIGIHTGDAVVGNMGSEQRFDYTLIGDNVNITSRLEGLNKEYKTHIIISEATKKRLSKAPELKSLGEVKVKGKTIPIKIFEVKC
jgi:adenylate cyclase